LVVGLSHSAIREDVSLLEGAHDVVMQHSRFPSYHAPAQRRDSLDIGTGGEGMLVQDDSLLLLDRLREVTQKAVQLEVSGALPYLSHSAMRIFLPSALA
jgi:hypothetical protein